MNTGRDTRWDGFLNPPSRRRWTSALAIHSIATHSKSGTLLKPRTTTRETRKSTSQRVQTTICSLHIHKHRKQIRWTKFTVSQKRQLYCWMHSSKPPHFELVRWGATTKMRLQRWSRNWAIHEVITAREGVVRSDLQLLIRLVSPIVAASRWCSIVEIRWMLTRLSISGLNRVWMQWK